MTVALVPNVPGFRRVYDAGSMTILALQAMLRSSGEDWPHWLLAGVSGDAFKFVYDRGEVYEPMRDRNPLDTPTLACAAVGWRSEWVLGSDIEDTKRVVRRSVEGAHPVLTSFLGERWYHGAVIIVGLDDESDEFLLQVAREEPRASDEYVRVPSSEGWSGPVPGPVVWADQPLFILEDHGEAVDKQRMVQLGVERAVDLHSGDALPYSGHPGAQKYSLPDLEGRTLPQGSQALEFLRDDISGSEISWPLIWRVDSQCGLLSYDRENASSFLNSMSEVHPRGSELRRTAELYDATSRLANELKVAFWNKKWRGEDRPDIIMSGLEEDSSFVYDVSGLSDDDAAELGDTVSVMRTPWGPAIVVDDSDRREHNRDIVEGIRQNEELCVDSLEMLAS